MTTRFLNQEPQDICVIAEENSTVIQYTALCEGKRKFCQYFFRGLYEFESLNGQEIKLKEIINKETIEENTYSIGA